MNGFYIMLQNEILLPCIESIFSTPYTHRNIVTKTIVAHEKKYMHNEESITLQIKRYGEHLGGISLTYMNTHKCIMWFYLRIKIHISAWKWSCYCKVARLNFFWHCSFSFKCAGKWAVWLKICITNIKWQLYAKMTTHFTKIIPLFSAYQSLFLYIPSHILICQKSL